MMTVSVLLLLQPLSLLLLWLQCGLFPPEPKLELIPHYGDAENEGGEASKGE